ncbi:YhcN/YlaJ family sporulation lipoprotein [Bacillus pacificus]
MKILIYLLMVCLLITGCSIGKRIIQTKSPSKKNVSMKNVNYTNKSNKPNEKAADHLASLAASVPGVNDATAVVVGKYAIVGIDVKAKLDRTRVESIKYSVAESLKNDPDGANAVVVADVDTYEKTETNWKAN